MNRDIAAGKWNEFKGEVKRQFGKLTDDELTQIQGSYEKLVGTVQKKYGYQKEQAEKENLQFQKCLPTQVS